MSLKLFSLILDVDRTVARAPRPLADAAPAVLESMLEVFAPRQLWVQVDGEAPFTIDALALERVGEQRLWAEEEVVPGAALTRCPPGPARALIDALRARLAHRHVSALFVGADGALRHRAAPTAEADWHGRWVVAGGLLEIASLRLQWTADLRAFELSLPHSGYPLTTARLARDGSLEAGEAAVAVANRAAILPVVGRVRGALGLTAGEARWHDDGDYAPLFRADADEVRAVWLPRLGA